MTEQPATLPSDQLRALVREVLRDALPPKILEAAAPGAAPRHVTLTTDAELGAFVQAIARECADPAARRRLADGQIAFRLAGAADRPGAVEPTGTEAEGVLRIERGVVTERHVKDAARRDVRLVAARGVVVTPLARDRARSSGVDIEKEA